MKLIKGTLPHYLQKQIIDFICNSYFPWFWNETTVIGETNAYGGFTHCLYNKDKKEFDEKSCVFANDLLKNVIDQVKVIELQRAQINFLCNINIDDSYEKNNIHTDHIQDEYLTFLYYVLDSDGDTVLYDKDNHEIEKISPKQGKYIIFKSNTLHRASPPIKNKKRIVINIVFKGEVIST